MKKILSLLLAAMLLLSCIPAMAEDAEWKINQYTGLVSRKSAAEKLDSIVVPAEVDGIAVRGIEYMAFNMHKNFKQLTIADGAVMLDRRVLRDLLKLEVVDLPENLLVIREGNFTNLPKLTSVAIPASVALVHSSFNKCASLTSITFEGMCPVFVTEGTFGMFTDLPADCVIYVPDNQVSAYKAAFADREDVVARIQPSGKNAECIDRSAPESDFVFDASTGTITGYTGSANYLEIPATIGGVQVKHIADDALLQKHSLCYIVVPEGVESLGASSLAGVESLSYVSLPSTLTSVGASAFSVSRVSAIAYNTAAVPAYEATAFANIKSDAWQLILPYGSSQELVDAFAAYIAADAPKGVVKASIIEPYSFPALDAEAGAPFIGTWNAVAVFDGTDYYGMDLLGISMIVTLQADGTGVVDMDGDAAPGGWYVENGTVVFAPILEEGGQPVPEEAMPFTVDENGRLILDLGGLYLLLELEGKTYDVPAIPEKPWPELDADKAKSYLGTWDAVSYIVEGETYDAALMGPMTLILNADGTAQMIEGEEEAYELRWYAESYSAYVGPTMSAAVEIYFDMNGNLQMKQDGSKVVFAPHVEAKVITGADELLGEWYDDLGNKLTLTNDGNLTHTYASDGWTDKYAWDVVDGAAVVTEGSWAGADIYTRDGLVFIDDDEGIFQIFSRDGDLSAYYGDDEDYEMPEAMPVGPEGEPYFGTWKADMYGMEVILTMNPDGTCAMEMFGGSEPAVWAVVDGKANIMGDELYIDGDGKLVFASQGMVFTKAGGAASSGPETPLGTWEDVSRNLYVKEDGTIDLVYKSDGYTSHMTWEMIDGVPTCTNGLWKGMPLTAVSGVLTITDGSYITTFTRVGEIPEVSSGMEQPAAGTEIDYVPSVADDFIGGWICKDDPSLQLLLLENEANLIDPDGVYTVDWSVVNGVAEFDGMKLYVQENYSIGILDMYGDLVEFERGYVEKPKDSVSDPEFSDDDDELTDEELLAFLALLGQMASSEGGEELPEELKPFVGTWHMVYIATGGFEGDLRSMGITGKLELKADGTGVLSGAADDSGKWYDDEGTVRFGQAETPLVLLDGGFLRYGSQLAGYMVFSQDESATWAPAPVATPVPAPTAAPAAPVPGGDGNYVGKTFVLTSAATVYAGQSFPIDASAFGEYKVCFHEDGKVTFVQAGLELPADFLTWSINADGAYVLTYAMGATVIMEYVFTPADGALIMDYYGTLMTFTPAE